MPSRTPAGFRGTNGELPLLLIIFPLQTTVEICVQLPVEFRWRVL